MPCQVSMRVLQVSNCSSKVTGTLDRLSVDEARIGARMGRAGRADGDDGAGADFAHAFAMGIAVDRFVGAQNRVAAAQQRDARRHAEAQALERREPGLGAPELRRRRHRVGLHGRLRTIARHCRRPWS